MRLKLLRISQIRPFVIAEHTSRHRTLLLGQEVVPEVNLLFPPINLVRRSDHLAGNPI